MSKVKVLLDYSVGCTALWAQGLVLLKSVGIKGRNNFPHAFFCDLKCLLESWSFNNSSFLKGFEEFAVVLCKCHVCISHSTMLLQKGILLFLVWYWDKLRQCTLQVSVCRETILAGSHQGLTQRSFNNGCAMCILSNGSLLVFFIQIQFSFRQRPFKWTK